MIFQKKKVTRSLSLLHHRATYGGESKQTDPSLQPHETVYKLLTDRGKKEVARPNQPTVSSPGGRRKTNTRRPRKSSRDRRPEEKGTCSFAAKSLQASRTTSRRKESRRGLVNVCVCVYICSLLRQLTKTVSSTERRQFYSNESRAYLTRCSGYHAS